MNAKEIQEILDLHEKWLRGLVDGKQANLTRADLIEADLTRANLTRADLIEANLTGANLTGADLTRANLTRADLIEANLTGANLTGANLYGADLTGADLIEANLTGANLTGANLYGANLTGANLLPDLYILRFQRSDTKLRAWKFLHADGKSPYQNHVYEVGKFYTADDFSTDERMACDKGLNVATLQWCLRNSDSDDNLFIEVEFLAGDIVAVPFTTDGKFRVKKLTVLRQITKVEAKKIIENIMKPYTKKAKEGKA